MHSILIAVKQPDLTAHTNKDERKKHDDWLHLCKMIQEDVQKTTSAQLLAPNIFSVAASDGLSLLGMVIHNAQQMELSCKVLFFEKPPEWIEC